MSILNFLQPRDRSDRDGEPEADVVERTVRNGVPAPGDILLLEFVAADPGQMPFRYQATVQTVGARRILVTDLKPLSTGAPANPFAAKISSVRVTYNRGSGLYRFDTAPVQFGREWALERPKTVIRIERRGYFRIMLEAPTVFTIEDGSADSRRPGRISNLSAGGVLLVSPVPLAEGQRIRVGVPTGKDGAPVDVVADVLESYSRFERGRPCFVTRARFVTAGSEAVHVDTREEIIAYIFEQQRLMLKTRRLIENTYS